MSKRIIIAGGGTGGHIFPAVAIANALKQRDPDIDILFVGAKGRMEMEKIPQAGYRIEGLDIAGFNRESLFKNIMLPVKMVRSFYQVKKIFEAFKPDAAIGVGGYSSFPVLRYAQRKGIPTFIHESNSFAGRANILLGKKATRIFTGSHDMERFFPVEKILISGNPVRKAIVNAAISREQAAAYFGLDPQRLILLVVGGSLGARSINEAVHTHLAELIKAGLQVIWQTGKGNAGAASQAAAEHKEVWAGEFITEMQYAYAAADIVMARAGAMTVAEITVAQKPAVFVPYPHAAEDHQTANALQIVNKNAAVMVPDNVAGEQAVATAIALAKDEKLRAEMSANLGRLAVKNADDLIANEILNTL